MRSRKCVMEDIFSKLNDKNKDMVILLAKSIRVAQESNEEGEKKNEQQEEHFTISGV